MIYNSEERIGIYSVAKIFAEELKWIFREQPINDFGIDGFIEVTMVSLNLRDRIPTGKLFGVQIKSGKSFFKETTNDHFIFRGTQKHLEYWLNHSIPVILIIYDKDLNLAYWQEVNISTVILTENYFKVQIPKNNLLNNKSGASLAGIAYFKNRYEYKLWQLQTSRDIIKLLISKQLFLYIEIDYLPNISEYHITLVINDEDCNNYAKVIYRHGDDNPNRVEYSFRLSQKTSLEEAIKDTLPWADLSLNGRNFKDDLLVDLIAREILSYDQQEHVPDVMELQEKNDFLGLACYLTGSSFFKLELKANELTFAFHKIDSFLDKDPIVKQRIYL